MHCQHNHQFSTTNHRGFSLIEVLFSVLVLAIGIIGTIRLQIHSLQTTQQSNFYSQAVQLANEMANNIRSNQSTEPETHNRYLQVNYSANEGEPKSSASCYQRRCNPSQLAEATIHEWLAHIHQALPNAKAVVCRDDQPWDSSTQQLRWECAGSADAAIVIKLGWTEQADQNTLASPKFALAVSP